MARPSHSFPAGHLDLEPHRRRAPFCPVPRVRAPARGPLPARAPRPPRRRRVLPPCALVILRMRQKRPMTRPTRCVTRPVAPRRPSGVSSSLPVLGDPAGTRARPRSATPGKDTGLCLVLTLVGRTTRQRSPEPRFSGCGLGRGAGRELGTRQGQRTQPNGRPEAASSPPVGDVGARAASSPQRGQQVDGTLPPSGVTLCSSPWG